RLDSRDIRPFLMSGTLLGFLREGTFLEYDHDVDLGLLPETRLQDVEDALVGSGLETTVLVEGMWLVAVHPSGLHVDFFRHELRDGRWWHCTRVHEWWNTPSELEPMIVQGQRWWIPNNPERYLDENYGNWRAPVAFFDISFDTPNRRYRRTPEAMRHLYHTCIRGIESGDRWMVESAARELRDEFGLNVSVNLATSPLLHEIELPSQFDGD
ncbi:MAG: hypothetical protein WBV89_21010, partial [Ilumatobacter sp.]